MVRKLREELIKLSTAVLTAREDKELVDLYETTKALYEKLAVLKFINEELNDIEVDVSKNVIAAKFEEMAGAVLNANTSVPESNPHQEDIMVPGMDTIKDMISEMPGAEGMEELLGDFLARPETENKTEITPPTSPVTVKEPKSVNDRWNKKLKIGLNDKLAFVKHLFNGDTEEYAKILAQLNAIETEERSLSFVQNMVKPEHGNWEGKEEYEDRFLALIQRRFN